MIHFIFNEWLQRPLSRLVLVCTQLSSACQQQQQPPLERCPKKNFLQIFFSFLDLTLPRCCWKFHHDVCAPKIPCRLFNNSVETKISLEPDMDLNLLYKLDWTKFDIFNENFIKKKNTSGPRWVLLLMHQKSEVFLVTKVQVNMGSYPFFPPKKKNKWNQSPFFNG